METNMDKEIKPFINIGPGHVIKEDLEALNWTQWDLAEIIGMSEKTVSKILNNKTLITFETARLLSKAFGQSTRFWMNLDAKYRLWEHEENSREKSAEKLAGVYKYMPIQEMIKKGWLSYYLRPDDLIEQVKSFWNIPDSNLSFMKKPATCFRKSDAFSCYEQYYIQTWFQMAKKGASFFKTGTYIKSGLENLAYNYTQYTQKTDGIEIFLKELESAGVSFFILSHQRKTYLDGAAFVHEGRPVVVYTARHDRLDNFWFTLAHEIAHVLLHLSDGKGEYLDRMDQKRSGLKEEQADAFALKMIKAKEIIDYCSPFKQYISVARVRQCAQAIQVGEALVVGVLKYCGVVPYRNLNRFKTKVSPLIPDRYFVERRLVNG
jgi:HTH-type transcriptional regulator/antitoxin HigA